MSKKSHVLDMAFLNLLEVELKRNLVQMYI